MFYRFTFTTPGQQTEQLHIYNIMNSLFKSIGIGFLTAVLAGFTSCSKPEAQGTPIADDGYILLRADKENNGKRFSIAGYPALSGDITTGADRKPMLDIYTEPEGKGSLIAALPIAFGKGPNEFHVPETFTVADITLYDQDGNPHQYTDKLRFSFTLVLRTDRPRSSVRIRRHVADRIEREEVMVYPGHAEAVRIDPAP